MQHPYRCSKPRLRSGSLSSNYDKVAGRPNVGSSPQALALQQATLTLDAAESNYKGTLSGATTPELDQARASVNQAVAGIIQASAAVSQTEAALVTAQASLAAEQARLDLMQAGTRPEQIKAAEAQVAAAEAQVQAAAGQVAASQASVDLLDEQISRLTIKAPTDGIVLTRAVEPGEVALPGGTLVVLGDLGHLSLTVYLPEDRYGAIHIGDKARITVDSFPGQTFYGNVQRVADQAEFTPRNVQTPAGRRTTVFAVKLALGQPGRQAQAGHAGRCGIRPMTGEWVLEARDLRMSFDKTRAVDGVSLAVGPGQAYGLVGPDGAGKTTTMRMLVGTLSGGSGDVRILGRDLRHAGPAALEHVGYLAQRFSLYAELTVQENLEFFGAVRGVTGADLAARSAELLRFVGLTGFERRRAGQLSGGMKQKLGLACALIHRPRLLLLDEPTTGVDPVTRQDFWQLIIRLLADGVAVVVSTPYIDEAARCNRLGFMHAGHMLTQGSPRELASLLAGRVLMLLGQPKALARQVCSADPEVEDVAAFGDRLHLRLSAAAAQTGPDHTIRRLQGQLDAAGVQVEDLRAIQPSLEDVFIALQAGGTMVLGTPINPSAIDTQEASHA